MRINVIGTILRVIFQYKNRGLFPDPAFAEVFNKLSKGLIVSATMARGVGIPIDAPAVWLLGRRMVLNCGTASFARSESNRVSTFQTGLDPVSKDYTRESPYHNVPPVIPSWPFRRL